eukprot:scaffold16263_cov39-Cyclotella_meneghiniana.AAC.5
MAFRQGVSEGMGSAPPSLQLRSFTSLFPLVGLFLASGNAYGGHGGGGMAIFGVEYCLWRLGHQPIKLARGQYR